MPLKKEQSLAEKMNDLITSNPVNFESDDEAEAKLVVNFDEYSDQDVRESQFRRQSIPLLEEIDERYKGETISRSYFNNGNDEGIESHNRVGKETESDSNQEDEEQIGELDSNIQEEENIEMHQKSTIDAEKGQAVRDQLKIWEKMLEIRIQVQKFLITGNQLPQHNMYQTYASNQEYLEKMKKCKTNLSTLLNTMLELQEALLQRYPETKTILSRHNQTKEKYKKFKPNNYERILKETHDSYNQYKNATIQKWNEKTQVASGNLLTSIPTLSILKQIAFATTDIHKMRRKTQLKRSEYTIIGKVTIHDHETDFNRVEEYDDEIFDDDDFYHQLLRDLIEFKSSDVTDPVQLSKQWIELQNMRCKMKKKVDTRATKGRKIRYNVHNKLVNFMAPIEVLNAWTNIAKNELCNSLFGKITVVE